MFSLFYTAALKLTQHRVSFAHSSHQQSALFDGTSNTQQVDSISRRSLLLLFVHKDSFAPFALLWLRVRLWLWHTWTRMLTPTSCCFFKTFTSFEFSTCALCIVYSAIQYSTITVDIFMILNVVESFRCAKWLHRCSLQRFFIFQIAFLCCLLWVDTISFFLVIHSSFMIIQCSGSSG